MNSFHIPELDISDLIQNHNDAVVIKKFSVQFSEALSSIGFVFLSGHGIEPEVVSNAMDASKLFFEGSSEQEKKAVASSEEKQQGYVSPGMEIFDQSEDGKKALHELRESYDVTNILPSATFPDRSVPKLRPALTKLANDTTHLANVILKCLSLALNQESDYLGQCHQRILGHQNSSKIRSLYYPSLTESVPEGSIRCGEHSDYGLITFLHQDSLGGLEVRSVDGSWVKAKPVPSSVLMNVGDLLEIYSDGLFPATLHRVVIPKEESIRRQPRQSVVFFVHPDYETEVSPLIKKTGKFRSINARQHILKRFAETYS